MAAPTLKHLLNHDDDSEIHTLREPILHWDGHTYLEEYAHV
jgi:hypothetical protein